MPSIMLSKSANFNLKSPDGIAIISAMCANFSIIIFLKHTTLQREDDEKTSGKIPSEEIGPK